MTAAPFVKWVGGKGRLLEQLGPLLPERVDTWVEPFMGGGGTLLGLGVHRAKSCLGNDVNWALVNAFRAVRDRVDDLMRELDGIKRMGPYRDVYYQLRDEYNARPEGTAVQNLYADVRHAALFIWLNKTGFNGLYRVNKLGKLNVACGNYTEPLIYDREALRETSAALQSVGLGHADYKTLLNCDNKHNFVYLDPPYTPVSATTTVVSYNEGGFNHAEHERLRDACVALGNRGLRFALSQADTLLTRELYDVPGWNISTVTVGRSVSRKASTRGEVTELVVRNYTLENEHGE